MRKILFQKFHCLGNDFIIIDLIGKQSSAIDLNRLAENICDRNCGIGADGILVLRASRRYDCFLDIYNSDGSWAEISGNGLRITAAYLALNHGCGKNVTIETKCDNPVAYIIRS
ncbi:MAG TPA: diaminopimelate epimerase, partial [candidate division Zixibacteria bacterium]|nr:diaminopimelate epimerase [candidate division Zixibacteria bacterium]